MTTGRRARADLHLHTTCSDGRLTPTELVQLVVDRGIEVMALTDHDTTQGMEEALAAARRYPQLRLIPGVELSTDVPGNEVHVLGYFIDYQDEDFQRFLARFRDSRMNRAQRMVEKLATLGIHIDWQRVKEIAGAGAVGRPHVAQAILEKGYISSIAEAFDRFIGRTGPAYVEREKMTPAEAVTLAAKVGGLPVLAHPRDLDNLGQLIEELKGAGLIGMEVYYQNYDDDTVAELLTVAKRYDLIPLGGSDYHGLGGPDERLPGNIPLPFEPVERLLKLAAERKVNSSTAKTL